MQIEHGHLDSRSTVTATGSEQATLRHDLDMLASLLSQNETERAHEPDAGVALALLTDLERRLCLHFALEAEHMELAIEVAPHRSALADALQTERRALRATIAELIRALESAGSGATNWSRVRSELDALRRSMWLHQQGVRRLLHEVYWSDLGGGD